MTIASSDELYQDAVSTVRNFGKASPSLLQRRLRIPYGRACALLEQMEKDGVVSAPDTSTFSSSSMGFRKVLKSDKPTLLRYCPRCGHALAEDMTAEKRFGVEVMLCPVDRTRFTYVQATETLHVVKI
jgi:hypothetical protein